MEYSNFVWLCLGFFIAWVLAFLYWLRDRKATRFYQSLIKSYKTDIEILEENQERLLQKNAEIDEQLELLTKEAVTLSSSLEKRQLLLIERDNQIRNFHATKIEFEKSEEAIREELFKKTEYNDFLHQQIIHKNVQIQKFEKELETQMTLNAQLRLQKDDVLNPILIERNQEIVQLHRRLASLLSIESEKITLTNQLSEMRLERARLQGFLSDKDKEIALFKDNLEQHKKELNQAMIEVQRLRLIDKTDQLEQQIFDKDDEIGLLHIKLDEASDKIDTLRNEFVAMESLNMKSVKETNETEIELKIVEEIIEVEKQVEVDLTQIETVETQAFEEVIEIVEIEKEQPPKPEILNFESENFEDIEKFNNTDELLDEYETENIEIIKENEENSFEEEFETITREIDENSAKLTSLQTDSTNMAKTKSPKKTAKLVDDYPEELEVEIAETELKETNTKAKTSKTKSKEVEEEKSATEEVATEKKKRGRKPKKSEPQLEAETVEAKSTETEVVGKSEVVEEKVETVEVVEESEEVKAIELKTDVDETEKSPVFKELAEPILPKLPIENRAKLQLQSPTRIFFYWTMKDNPYEPLFKIFGEGGKDFILVAKLINITEETEELYPIQTQGDWWFNVKSDCKYRAEIGFFAPNRPFIRLLYSNDLETPRLSPSNKVDMSPEFSVSATQFAESLEVSGYQHDAIEVAMTGDDAQNGDVATENSYLEVIGKHKVEGVSLAEMRFALIALASGIRLDSLREAISPQLFAELNRSYGNLTVDNIIEILERNFGIKLYSDESNTTFENQQQFTYAVFGLSMINFPKTYSSFSVGKK
jgi:hypothetical protein